MTDTATPLAGQVAVVTGGGSGLGAGIALRLADAGAAVVIADVDAGAAEATAAALADRHQRGLAVTADVVARADVERVMAAAQGLGRLSILVLSAAVEIRRSVVDTTDEAWRRVIDTNLKGPFLCMRAAIPIMAAGGGGSIVALGSTLGLIAAPGYPAYCASKGALVNLCKQAAIEHAGDQVRVNVVAPSATEAGLFWKMTAQADDPDKIRRQIARNVPMGRLGQLSDVAEAVLFLASDASSYISGTVLAVDGGLAARRS